MCIGENLIYLPICQSTNTHLAELAQQTDLPEGSTVYTFHQTAGRGQRGSRWESEPHANLTFSYLLFPEALPLEQMFALSMATALGVYDFLKGSLPEADISIKYPNDLYVGKQKIAGILIENALKGTHIEKSIVGIGLNINQIQFENPRATSLRLSATGLGRQGQYSLETCLREILLCLDKRYEILKLKKYFEIKVDFLAKNFQINELCTYYTSEGEVSGKIIDIDLAGKLYLETDKGIKPYYFKEIAFFMP